MIRVQTFLSKEYLHIFELYSVLTKFYRFDNYKIGFSSNNFNAKTLIVIVFTAHIKAYVNTD